MKRVRLVCNMKSGVYDVIEDNITIPGLVSIVTMLLMREPLDSIPNTIEFTMLLIGKRTIPLFFILLKNDVRTMTWKD